LAKSVARLPEHYGVLRTSFVAASEGTVCLPSPQRRLPVRILDEPRASTARLQEIASEFCNAPFDLERGETGRALLIRSDPADHLLVVVFHHIAIDQWSYELLLPRLAADYAALAGGRPPRDASADSYAEYAVWHRHWFREHGFKRERTYWIAQLDDAQRTTFEPDRHRPPMPSYRGDRVPLAIIEEQWLTLEALAQRGALTPALCLHRLGARASRKSRDRAVQQQRDRTQQLVEALGDALHRAPMVEVGRVFEPDRAGVAPVDRQREVELRGLAIDLDALDGRVAERERRRRGVQHVEHDAEQRRRARIARPL
ncbi:hypothetical protein EON77_19520, partial [bacterium]